MEWNFNMSEAPKDHSILVCKRGMEKPWPVRWYEGKRTKNWKCYGMTITFIPDCWMEMPECPK